MGLFGDTKVLMEEYITKTNEIYNSTVGISTDINAFNSKNIEGECEIISTKLLDVSTAIDDVSTAIANLSDCSDSNASAIDDINANINTININIEALASDSLYIKDTVTSLKDNYSVIDAIVSGLSSSIKGWIDKSSKIFGYTVELLEKAKEQGCS